MGKTILEEAVEDVQNLKKAAEENAKNLLVEAMSPRIKDFIQQHLGQEGVETPAGPVDGAPAGNNDTVLDQQGDQGDAGDDGDASDDQDDEQDDNGEVEFDFESDEDEDDDDNDDSDDEDQDDEDQGDDESVDEAMDDDDSNDSDDEDDDDMEESVEITSEDLKRAFLSAMKNGLKEDAGKFSDQQDPNDGEYGLVHKVPGEVMWADGAKVLKKSKNAKMVTKEQHQKTVQKLHRQLAQYQEAFKYLKKNLHEMNLFNAKLIYTTKLLQNNLTNKQKLQVVEKLDKARSKREVEFMYNTLSESFKIAGVLGEGRTKLKGPKASRVMKPGATLNEGKTQETTQTARWAVLAGLND